jgi:hypothetical protein
MLLLNYGVDLGATGYGRAGTAILKLSDTIINGVTVRVSSYDYIEPNSIWLLVVNFSISF